MLEATPLQTLTILFTYKREEEEREKPDLDLLIASLFFAREQATMIHESFIANGHIIISEKEEGVPPYYFLMNLCRNICAKKGLQYSRGRGEPRQCLHYLANKKMDQSTTAILQKTNICKQFIGAMDINT